jgi:hypothetical protein
MHRIFGRIGGLVGASLVTAATYVLGHADQVNSLAQTIATHYPAAAPVAAITGTALALFSTPPHKPVKDKRTGASRPPQLGR